MKAFASILFFLIKSYNIEGFAKVKNFKAEDYNEYNEKLGLFNYRYFHRLLDVLYRLYSQYNFYDKRVSVYHSEFGNQVELKGTIFFDINKRIKLHQQFFKKLWKKRHKQIIKQLKLFELYSFSE